MAHSDINRPPRDRISDISFRMYNSDEVFRISVKEIQRPEIFDELLHPIPGGLYDPALGSLDIFSDCASCGCKDKICPGHVGHIELSLPVYNPVFFTMAFQLIRGTCFNCHRLFCGANSLPGRIIMAQLKCLDRGMISAVAGIQSAVSNAFSAQLEDDTGPEPDEDSPKKKKGKRFSTIMDDSFDLQLEEKLQAIMKELLKAENETDNSKSDETTRNVLNVRRALVTEFCKKFLYNRRKKCPHCRHTSIPVARRAQQVIIIGSASTKATASKGPTKKDENFQWFEGADAGGGADFGHDTGPKPKRPQDIKREMLSDVKATKELDDDSVHQVISNIVAGNDESILAMEANGRRVLSPIEARQHLRSVWASDGELLHYLFPLFSDENTNGFKGKSIPTDILFLDFLPVPPSQFRPVASMNGMKFESRQTAGFRQVIELNILLKHFVTYSRGGEDNTEKQVSEQVIARIKGKSFTEKLQNTYIQLQARVNGILDSSLAPKIGMFKGRGGDDVQSVGVRQILEKKQGIFRMNMMGKRVNFACRTVITPDPYMDVDGIGIPDIFAHKLTFPTPVSQLNLKQMRKAVINGPNNYPGANFIVSEFGHQLLLNDKSEDDRKSVAKRLFTHDKGALVGPKKVLRHMLPGDYMLLNRQPTLHKPSIMAHKVHILRDQKTLRLNYSTCKTYNADFDGDEMNAHLPQDLLSQAECHEIMNVINQYLVPKDGTPISGLIQDHIISGVLLTLKDKFFSKEDYEFLVMSAFGFLKQNLRILSPAIWKPVVRWTGKQVVSTVIVNVIPAGYPLISLDGKAKTGIKNWQTPGQNEPNFEMSDSHVVFRQCELLVGVFDKNHYGPTANGLVHCVYEIYGPRVACNLLSCFSRLFTTYLQLHGFSLGVADLLVSRKADKKRKKIIDKKLKKCGLAAVREVFRVHGEEECRRSLEECFSKREKNDVKQLDFCMKSQTDQVNDKVNKACLPHGLVQRFPNNGLLLMIECGAKGNMVNSMQMSCMLGQIELEGSRPTVTPAGRTLPSFKPYDHSPRAGGFVAQRFLTGVKPQEFFFHCMAGREGLIDTAVKTSRSGYLQRCLIKHLESVMVNYDLTVRDADQSVIQFQYGEDGLDISKVQFLQGKQVDFLLDNFDAFRTSVPNDTRLERMSSKKSDKWFKKIKAWEREHAMTQNGDTIRRPYDSPFTAFSRKPNINGLPKDAVLDEWRKLENEECKELIKKFGTPCPDPVTSIVNPCSNFGAMSENLLKKLDALQNSYKQPNRFEEFRRSIYWKGMKSLAEPGEAVGLLAAQSIGEPSTQMTLNTFHFAGRGEMNVTLGIPRLREILMTASEKISTPSAQVPFRPHITQEQIKELYRQINNIRLDEVLDEIGSEERLTLTSKEEYREYKVTVKFTKLENRPLATSHLKCSTILGKVEKSFFKRICLELKKMCDNALAYEKSRQAGRERIMRQGGGDAEDDSVPEVQPTAAEDEDMSDDEREAANQTDADAADTRLRQRHNDENEYVGEEEEEEDVGQADGNDEAMSSSDAESTGLNDEETQKTDFGETGGKKALQSTAKVEVQHDAARVKTVLNSSKMIVDYEYDVKKNRWCRITISIPARFGSVDIVALIQKQAKGFPVQGIPGVHRCILGENGGRQVLMTEGINLQAFFEKSDYFEVNKIYCNDIHMIAKTYGIEAALKALMKETKNVFGNYGIVVDYRHLSLVADYMMHTGFYQPFNRSYMASSTSPFQKMSFETSMKFLKDSLESGEKDSLHSMSASIAVGKAPKVGTGFFDVLVKLK